MKKEKTNNSSKYVLLAGIVLIVVAIALVAHTMQQPKEQFSNPALIINGEEVSLDEVRSVYAASSIPGPRELVLQAVTNDIINYRLILQDAKNKGITVTQDEVNEAFNALLQSQQITELELISALEGTGATIDEYKLRIQEDILVGKILSEELDANVSDSEVNQYYQNNIGRFLVPEEVVVRQISLPANLTEEQLTNAANTIFNALQTTDFCEVAEQYSVDKSCNSYGIRQGDAFPAYVNAAFNQEVGQITLVQGPDGYYFVQTLNKLNFNPVPLSQAGEGIQQQLGQEKFQEAYARYLESLRENAQIVNTLQ